MSAKRVPRSIGVRDGFVTSTPIPTAANTTNTFASPATTTTTMLVPATTNPANGLVAVQQTVSALQPAAVTVTGQFYTSGRWIIDPNGNKFRPFGGNIASRHSPNGAPYILNYHGVDALGSSADVAQCGWSAIRLDYYAGANSYYTDVQLRDFVVQIIQEYSARNIAVIVGYIVDPSGMDWYVGNPNLITVNNWWIALLTDSRVSNNPWWWVSYLGENISDGNDLTNWAAVYTAGYNAVRTADPSRIFSACTAGFGQGYKELIDSPTAASFMTGKTNVVIEWHNYGTGKDLTAMTAAMNSYIAAGIPYFTGEFGATYAGAPDDAAHRSVPVTPIAQSQAAVDFTLDVQHPAGFGSMWWHAVGTSNSDNVLPLRRSGTTNGTFNDFSYPVTANGQKVWDRGHESHNLGPGNTGGTGGPVAPPPTTTPSPGPGMGTTTPGTGNGNGGTGGVGANVRTVYFTDITAGNPTTWSWEFRTAGGALLGTSTAQDPFYTFPAAGSYRVSLTVNVSTHTTVKEVTVT